MCYFTEIFCLCYFTKSFAFVFIRHFFSFYINYPIYQRYHNCINISISFISIINLSCRYLFLFKIYIYLPIFFYYQDCGNIVWRISIPIWLCAHVCPSKWLVNNNHKSIDLTDKNVVPFHRRISSHDLPIVSKN